MSNQAQFDALMDMANYDKPLHPALVPWITETEIMGQMVKHPYVFSTLGDDLPPPSRYKANTTYEKKLKIRREILDEKNWWAFLFILIERPYRMVYLERLYLRNRISHEQMTELLPEVWTDTEAPQVNQEEPMRLFRAANFVTDDPEGWDKIKNEPLVLYRGVDGHLEITKDGPSWTLDRKVAEFFAYRWGAKGKVYTYTADPSEALAYITAREEAEIILDFDRSRDGQSRRKEIRLAPLTS